MPGVEVLDEVGTPLLMDAFPFDERQMGFQLYQRGLRWTTLQRGLQNKFARSPRELIDEWTMGLEMRNMLMDQLERELIEKLNNPRIRYLDYTRMSSIIRAHNRESNLNPGLAELDSIVGLLMRFRKLPRRETARVSSDMGLLQNSGDARVTKWSSC